MPAVYVVVPYVSNLAQVVGWIEGRRAHRARIRPVRETRAAP
jgi:hypothetical protein